MTEQRSSARVCLRSVLAVACFAVFALAAVSLHQEQTERFIVEEAGPIPAALSHLLFGTPLGFADTGLLQYFQTSDVASAEEVVERVTQGAAVPTHDTRMPLDGIGIGPPLADTIAFGLFGPHARSLLRLFLTLLGLSTASYILRFRRERLGVTAILLAAFTGLLLTRSMEMPLWASEAPIGGERTYILLAILPVLHWCFEIVAGGSRSRSEAMFRASLLGIQVTILGFAILVRYSPICLIPAVLVSAFLAWRSGSTKRAAALSLLPLAGLIIVLYGVVPRAFPDQADSGRLRSLIWHRAFISYSVNPDWPFPGVVEQYTCPQVPGGITAVLADSNAHCVWFAALMNQSRPAAEVWAELYGADYERVLRNALFDVAFKYPEKTLVTILYYKPLRMVTATWRSLTPWPTVPLSVGALAALQFVLLAGFLTIEPTPGRGVKPGTAITIVAALAIGSFIPHLLAWTNPAVGQELAAGVLCGAIVSGWLGCRVVLRRYRLRKTSSAALLADRKADA